MISGMRYLYIYISGSFFSIGSFLVCRSILFLYVVGSIVAQRNPRLFRLHASFITFYRLLLPVAVVVPLLLAVGE